MKIYTPGSYKKIKRFFSLLFIVTVFLGVSLSAYAPAADIDGQERLNGVGDGIDMGADEYHQI